MPADRRFPPRRGGEERPHPHQPARLPGPPVRQGDGVPFTATSFRLRDGDREVEVSGSAGFVRQVLDDLPALIARLRGETRPTPTSIRMPSPGAERPALEAPAAPSAPAGQRGGAGRSQVEEPESGDGAVSRGGNGRGGGSLEERVLTALRSAGHPLPVAEIRGRVGGDVSGQQVRRILERAGTRVVATSDRPIRYRLR